jgi:hypothetical protein
MPKDGYFSDRQSAERRDEVVRRMAMTPPDHKTTSRPKKKKLTGSDRTKKARAPESA